ncbi:B3 DNA binding domain containing protein [Trema orientale]|uniref:B3 DNA binding domain containing protein n=1 Tax=Trema orientale TaxID=63057 RepID=A0A2P5FXZ7_TREOI|nr:B3 DNA binding domain containing protein [Trema orientale]
MNLRSRRDTSQPSFSAVTPHFFRIVQENTLRDKRLLIPKKFVHKYGETLSSKVFVKLPCGSEWEMELRKLDGCVWLGKGWPEFAGHYSIGYGDLLVFRYEGNSRFHALIFDPSTVEIDYPLITSHFDAPKRGEITDDDSIEILEDYSLCTRKRKNSPLPHSRPQENSKTGPIVKTEIHFSQRGPNERTPAQPNEKIPGNSMRKLHFLAEDGDKDRLTTPIRRKCEAGRRMEQMTANDEVKALCRDSCFKSKRLTCKIVMQPSQVIKYYDMTFPRYFAR